MNPIWRRIVHWIGGIYDCGRLSLIIHDHGVNVAWVIDRVEKWRIGW
jgi:hypothetical protein